MGCKIPWGATYIREDGPQGGPESPGVHDPLAGTTEAGAGPQGGGPTTRATRGGIDQARESQPAHPAQNQSALNQIEGPEPAHHNQAPNQPHPRLGFRPKTTPLPPAHHSVAREGSKRRARRMAKQERMESDQESPSSENGTQAYQISGREERRAANLDPP